MAAPRGIIMMGLVLVLAAAIWTRAAAQTLPQPLPQPQPQPQPQPLPQPQPQPACTNALAGLAPCFNNITGNMPATPSSSCCSQLASVVQASPRCLCSLLNVGGAPFGIAINQTQALTLPGACNVQTPPVSQCNAVANAPSPLGAPLSAAAPESSPVGSPASSPTESSHETPAAATPSPSASTVPASTAPSGPKAGSKAVPSTNGSTSNGSIARAPLHIVGLVLLAASIMKGF